MSLGNVLGAAAPIAAGYFLGPAAAGALGTSATTGAIAAGALTGAGIAALTGQDPLMGGITGGFGGMGGGSLSGAMDAATKAKLATTIPGTTSAGMNAGLQNVASANLAQAGLPQNLGMMSNPAALSGSAGVGGFGGVQGLQGSIGPNMNQVNKFSVNPGVTGPLSRVPGYLTPDEISSNLTTGGGYTFKDFERAALPTGSTDIGINDIAGQLGKNAETGELNPALGYGKMALTASGPVMAAFEPEVQTFDELRGDKYDPTRSLNLDNIDTGIGAALKRDTGLRLLAGGGYLETGGRVGDGMSDDIKAIINNEQEARLSDGEFVVPADVVSHLGNGSSDAGAKRLYDMMDKIRQARTGTIKQGREINPERYMPA
jgi:hypothetical protein